jgi:hypothetical protein
MMGTEMLMYLSVIIPQFRQLFCKWIFTTRNFQRQLHASMKYIVVVLHSTCGAKIVFYYIWSHRSVVVGSIGFEFQLRTKPWWMREDHFVSENFGITTWNRFQTLPQCLRHHQSGLSLNLFWGYIISVL